MKTLKCRDAGFDCNTVIQANTEEEVLQQAGKHAQDVHGVNVTPEMANQLKTLIKDDGVKQ
jgi:predicted small metal-binding protein